MDEVEIYDSVSDVSSAEETDDPMDEEKIYDAVSDVKGFFSSEFKNYVEDQNLLCHKFKRYGDFGGKYEAWLFKKEQQHVESAHPVLTNNLITIFKTLSCVMCNCMIQFWRAEEVTSANDFGDRHFILTTRNQPFLISGSLYSNRAIEKGICSYRTKMDDIVVRDGGGGVIDRVFRNKRLEFTPNIRYYSDEEYPLRDLALSCNIEASLAIPLSDPSGCSVGVVEIVSDYNLLFSGDFFHILQDSSSLKYLPRCKNLCGQFDLKDESLRIAVYEIRKIMDVICEDNGRSQTWMLCSHCEFLSTSCSLENVEYCDVLVDAEYLCTLKKGEGVVGKAAISSHNLVYCEDASQFSITEYPLAHVVRYFDLTPSFAICLKSDLTGSQIYVLEFIFDKSEVNIKGMRAILVPILEEMRHNLKTFKLASGEEIGDNLSVEVIDARSPHISQIVKIGELNSVENHVLETDLIHNGEGRGVALALLDQQHNTSEISRADSLKDALCTDSLAIENGDNMVNSDERDVAIIQQEKLHNHVQIHNDALVNDVGTLQPPLVQVNDVVHTEKNIVGTSKEGIVNSSKLPFRMGGINISLKELEEVSGMKLKDAAQTLNVSVSTFRPPHKRKIDQTGSTKELRGSAPAVQNESLMTINGEYGDNLSVPVLDHFREKNVTLRNRELDLSLAIGMNNTHKPYLLPHSIGETSTEDTDDPTTREQTSFHDTPTEKTRTLFSASTVQSELRVTVKANFGGDFFMFQLFSSSGIDELNEKVSQRLKLEVGNYVVKYKDDDNDLINIVCDEDLHFFISSSISKGKWPLKVLIEPIKAS